MTKLVRSLFLLTVSLSLTLNSLGHTADNSKSSDVQKLSPKPVRKISAAKYDHQPPKALSPVGVATGTAVSPGAKIGETWYEYQQNRTMGRMIGWGPHSGGEGYGTVHFTWMYLPAPVFELRKYAYNAYSSESGQFLSEPYYIQPDDEYAGYVNIDVTPDNRAAIIGHNTIHNRTEAQVYFDAASGTADFEATARLSGDGPDGGDVEYMWPKFSYQFGTDTVLHVLTQYETNDGFYALCYWRKVGLDDEGVWDSPGYWVDTLLNLSHAIAAERSGNKLALVWAACLNYQEEDCDTCSGISPYEDTGLGEKDNDIYYQISYDQGSTWQPRVNLTKLEPGATALKANCDLSALIDLSGQLHILWPAVPWPADPALDMSGFGSFMDVEAVMLHWSEAFDDVSNPYPYIRTVASSVIPDGTVSGGTVAMAKPSLGECDGKFFALWAQSGDIASGLADYSSQYYANTDLWVSVSQDAGITWDRPRNLTNTATPGCDPSLGVDCASENWPSMAPYGRANQIGENWTGAEIVDPSGSYSGSNYLDVQYILDRDAGAVIYDEGTWQLADVRWFRLPCVEPVPGPTFVPEFQSWSTWFFFPETKVVDTAITIMNAGNSTLYYSIEIEEETGPAGWLNVVGFSGSLASGFDNTEQGLIVVDVSEVEGCPNYELRGRLIFDGNDSEFPDTISISVYLCCCSPVFYDTVNTDCLSLVVSNTANVGRMGQGKVNMDFVNSGDCDSTAKVYIYDGSPVVGWQSGIDTIVNSYIWGTNLFTPSGFRPIGGEQLTTVCSDVGEMFQTGVFVTHDSTIAMNRFYFAPINTGSACNFIIQYLRVYSYDAEAHSGLAIGDLIDFDIPHDSLNPLNTGGVSESRKLAYQVGSEFYLDDATYPYNCQYNNARLGGIAFIGSYLNGVIYKSDPYSASVEPCALLEGSYGPDEQAVYEFMQLPGYRSSELTTDLATVMCYEPQLSIGPIDVYEVFSVMATVQNGSVADLEATIDAAKAWFFSHGGNQLVADIDGDGVLDMCSESCCVGARGNIDGYGVYPNDIDIADLVYLVNYMFTGGPTPPCFEEADINGDGQLDIADLVCLVNFMFGGESSFCEPVPCP